MKKKTFKKLREAAVLSVPIALMSSAVAEETIIQQKTYPMRNAESPPQVKTNYPSPQKLLMSLTRNALLSSPSLTAPLLLRVTGRREGNGVDRHKLVYL